MEAREHRGLPAAGDTSPNLSTTEKIHKLLRFFFKEV